MQYCVSRAQYCASRAQYDNIGVLGILWAVKTALSCLVCLGECRVQCQLSCVVWLVLANTSYCTVTVL